MYLGLFDLLDGGSSFRDIQCQFKLGLFLLPLWHVEFSLLRPSSVRLRLRANLDRGGLIDPDAHAYQQLLAQLMALQKTILQ
jgi:hypothetical protein